MLLERGLQKLFVTVTTLALVQAKFFVRYRILKATRYLFQISNISTLISVRTKCVTF